MKSLIRQAIHPQYAPVAVLFTDEKPDHAISFQENRYGCVAAMLSAAAKGRTVAFDRKTFGCSGGGVGLGFGNCYENFPGGIGEFLSTGNAVFAKTDFGQKMMKVLPQIEKGERYLKNPAIAEQMINSTPIWNIKEKYVVFQPLENVPEYGKPQVVIFFANPDQLTALCVLANYARTSAENVIAPFGSGCQQIGVLVYKEGEAEHPRAVIGLTDITVRKFFAKDILSFSVPYKMYLEMESNVNGSFLDSEEWQDILRRNQ